MSKTKLYGRIVMFGALCLLGFGTMVSLVAVFSQAALPKFVQVDAGNSHSIALDERGNVWVWGANQYSQLGYTTAPIAVFPMEKLSARSFGGKKIAAIAANGSYNMALDESGNIWEWGTVQGNSGLKLISEVPAKLLLGDNVKIKKIAAGSSHSMAIDADGNLWSWGRNHYGQLGDGTETDRQFPVIIEKKHFDGESLLEVSAGNLHSIAISESGSVWTWGANDYGQLGNGRFANQNRPVRIDSNAFDRKKVKAVTAGIRYCMVLDEMGFVWTWGNSEVGQLGDTTSARSTPDMLLSTRFDGKQIRTIAVGGRYSVAIDEEGCVWTWGDNAEGELSDGTRINRQTPTMIPVRKFDERQVDAIGAGASHVITTDEFGSLWAWGNNLYRQLGGDWTRTSSLLPKLAYESPASSRLDSSNIFLYVLLGILAAGSLALNVVLLMFVIKIRNDSANTHLLLFNELTNSQEKMLTEFSKIERKIGSHPKKNKQTFEQ